MGKREFDYDALVKPLELRMMRLIWRIVRHREAADDALQDALAVIWRKREAVAVHPNPQALIFRIAAGAALDVIRKNRRRLRFEVSGTVEERADPSAAPVEKGLEERGLRAAVLEAIGRLPGRQAEAALLHIVEERPFAEIAQAMGCSEITAAFRLAAGRPAAGREERSRAAYFWTAAARNAWLLGALGGALNFTIAMSGESGGIPAISNRMIQSFIVSLYGLVLAVVCLVPAMKLAGTGEGKAGGERAEGGAVSPNRDLFEKAAGYVLFAAVLGLTVYSMVGGRDMQTGPISLVKVLLYWPAILVVVGGAIALALFMGGRATGRSLTIGFGMTGFVALFMGIIQALFGFVRADIVKISGGIAFIISGCAYALLGLAAVAAPLEDREAAAGRCDRPGPFSRMIWIVFPILVNIFLLLAFIMVVTPMKKPG